MQGLQECVRRSGLGERHDPGQLEAGGWTHGSVCAWCGDQRPGEEGVEAGALEPGPGRSPGVQGAGAGGVARVVASVLGPAWPPEGAPATDLGLRLILGKLLSAIPLSPGHDLETTSRILTPPGPCHTPKCCSTRLGIHSLPGSLPCLQQEGCFGWASGLGLLVLGIPSCLPVHLGTACPQPPAGSLLVSPVPFSLRLWVSPDSL